jgi:hypothetical protein
LICFNDFVDYQKYNAVYVDSNNVSI